MRPRETQPARITPEIKGLIGQDLSGFKLEILTEVYMTDEDGIKRGTAGFFRDKNVAEAFADNVTDANFTKTAEAAVFHNGTIGFRLAEEVKLLDDEKEALRLREAALAKLSPAERAVLKL